MVTNETSNSIKLTTATSFIVDRNLTSARQTDRQTVSVVRRALYTPVISDYAKDKSRDRLIGRRRKKRKTMS